jgi:hypothetical protein
VYRPPDIDHWCGNLLCSAADLLAGGLMAKWKCIDPVLQTFKCGKFTAQRTYLDMISLFKGKFFVGTYADLDSALKAVTGSSDA